MIATAAKMVEKLAETLYQYQLQIAADKALWLYVGAEEDNLITLEEFPKSIISAL